MIFVQNLMMRWTASSLVTVSWFVLKPLEDRFWPPISSLHYLVCCDVAAIAEALLTKCENVSISDLSLLF